jgi:hypothetical protein
MGASLQWKLGAVLVGAAAATIFFRVLRKRKENKLVSTPATLETTGMVVPPSFPARSYNDLHQHVMGRNGGNPSLGLYGGAWNALSYRYAEARECADYFAEHFTLHGSGPPPPERYKQEKALFDFYSSVTSCFDAYGFAVFAMASLRQPANFPLATDTDERRVTLKSLLKKLNQHCAGDALIASLDALLADPRYLRIDARRNVLTHRQVYARTFYMGGADDGIARWSRGGDPLSAGMLQSDIDDVDALLQRLIPDAEQFARRWC